MPIGSKFKFTIPPELAYGSRATGSIPANSTLIFEVELFSIEKAFVDTDFSLPGKEETTESGLRMIIHKEGSGDVAKAGQTVVVHYTGLLETGKKFDSSHDRGQPFSFASWSCNAQAALAPMNQKRTIIPPELGYGERQVGPFLPIQYHF